MPFFGYVIVGFLFYRTFTAYQPLIKFCKRDDAQVRHWASVYEEAFGTKISELVQDWRSHPSPPEQHQYPSHSIAQPQQTTQQQDQDQQLFQNHAHPHMHHSQHQLTNRRLSYTNSQISIGLGSNSRSPNNHGELSSSYINGSSNVTSNNNLSHKSASNVPLTSYPLGRPANSNNSSNIRTTGMNPHPSSGPDSSSSSNRDSRVSLTATGSSVAVGQILGHGGDGNDCLNPTLLGKYVDRESSAQAVSSLSRWPLLAGDSGGGGSGDSGIHQNGIGGTGGSGNVGGAAGNGNINVNAQRNLALLGDGAQSLPSLKDSGLLDSWGSSRVAADTQKQTSNGSPQQQQKQQQSLTTLPKATTLGSSISMALPSTSQHYASVHHQDGVDLRPTTTLGMPVGMSWLANESR